MDGCWPQSIILRACIPVWASKVACNHITPSHLHTDLDMNTTSRKTHCRSQPVDKLSDDKWLKEWMSLSTGTLATPLVPDQACYIHTPLVLASWREALGEHPNQPLTQIFFNGISKGFRLDRNYGSMCLKPAQKNLENALQHKEVVTGYLQEEIRR